LTHRLTIELWSRKRVEYCNILLTSLINQTFTDWDLTFLEEYDCKYLANDRFRAIIRLIKRTGHNVTYLRPQSRLGCARSAIEVMKRTTSKYAMKMDDDHLLAIDCLEKLVNVLDSDPTVGAVGGMLYPINEDLIDLPSIPRNFNRWSGKDGRWWNDYTTLRFRFKEQLVDVDFIRAPFMYRADLLRQTDFFSVYPTLGYSHMAHRIESEITNTIQAKFNTRNVIHTGVAMYHFYPDTGGCRLIPSETRIHDDQIYYDRWGHLHDKRRVKA